MTNLEKATAAKAAQPPSTSLDYTQHNCNSPNDRVSRPKRRGCGAFTLVGLKDGKYQHLRSKCKSYRCGVCGPYKLRRVRKRIVALAVQHGLFRFLTLTLDPSKLDPNGNLQAEIAYLRECWRKMRVYIERKLGHPLVFIAVVELQQSGRPHLHLLIGSFLRQSWVSNVWDALGGGKIVDLRWIQITRVAAYLAKYITEKDLCEYPPRVRRFSTSLGLALFDRTRSSAWRLFRTAIEILHKYCRGVETEARDSSGVLVSFVSAEPPPEVYSLQPLYKRASRWSEAKYIFRTDRTTIRPGLRFSPRTRSLEYQRARVVPGVQTGDGCELRRERHGERTWQGT
jgi:hypothetical protein